MFSLLFFLPFLRRERKLTIKIRAPKNTAMQSHITAALYVAILDTFVTSLLSTTLVAVTGPVDPQASQVDMEVSISTTKILE